MRVLVVEDEPGIAQFSCCLAQWAWEAQGAHAACLIGGQTLAGES
jgi:hypothetical protein